jgi:hypothetical protein
MSSGAGGVNQMVENFPLASAGLEIKPQYHWGEKNPWNKMPSDDSSCEQCDIAINYVLIKDDLSLFACIFHHM